MSLGVASGYLMRSFRFFRSITTEGSEGVGTARSLPLIEGLVLDLEGGSREDEASADDTIGWILGWQRCAGIYARKGIEVDRRVSL